MNNYDFPWIAPSCKWLLIQKITGRQPIFDAEDYFRSNPKRAGKKIWEIDFFQDMENLNSGNYREW